MNIKGTKIGQKIIATILIVILTLADFILIGINTVTYAIDSSKTNADNVEFMAYFENEKGERITLNEKYINEKAIKLKVDVTVKGEGYFDGELTFNDTNFKVTTLEKNSYVKKLDGNKIVLNRINAGTTATIGMEIEFNVSDEMDVDILNKVTKINLTGNYVYSKKSIEIKGETAVEVKWKTPENAIPLLNAEMLTFLDYKLPVAQTASKEAETNIEQEVEKKEERKIAQILVDSKIKDDIYPIKNTKIEMTVPENVEEVKVHKRLTDATNGNKEFNTNNYSYDKEKHMLTINVANDESNGKIKHIKNSRDTFVVTYKYKKDAQDSSLKTSVKSTITTYDNKELTATSEVKTVEQKDGIITNKINTNESQIYKGKIYSGEARTYNTTTKINIDLAEAVTGIEQKEEKTTFVKGEELFEANTEFRQTKINRKEFIELFGEDGVLTIKDQDGAVIANITKDIEVDENNNIVVKYNEGTKSITISASAPKAEGILKINHTKVILDTKYKREETKEFIAIREKVNTTYTKIDGSKSNSNAYQLINLQETETSASLELEKNTLSVTEKNQNLQMKLILNTDNETKDLYKNPKIKITFPEEITKVSAKCKLLYGNGLEIKSAKVTNENGKQVMMLELKGEQMKYQADAVNKATLLVYADVIIDKMSTSGNRQIVVNYSNENATKYSDGGKQVADIQIINEKEMILTNSIKDLNVQTIGDEKTKEIKLPMKATAKNTSVDMQIINNEEKDIENVIIFGKIPEVEGKIERASEVKLNTEAKVYYTDVENPTTDLNNKTNKWTTNNIKNSINYLIVIDKMKKDEKVQVSYDINFQKNLGYNLMTNAGYKVSYDIESHTQEVSSTILKLGTGVVTELKPTLSAIVGKDILKDGDEVKAGEIIKYNVNIKNAGKEDANYVTLSAKVPDGTTLIEVNESGYFIDKDAEESTDRVTNNKITNTGYNDDSLIYFKENASREININDLKVPAESEVNYTFMVQVNSSITNDVNSTFDMTMQYKDETKSQKISHKLVSSNLSAVTIPMTRLEKTELSPEREYIYSIKVKNLSNEEQKNVKVTLNKNDLMDFKFLSYESELQGKTATDVALVVVPVENTTFEIPSVSAGDTINIHIEALIKSPTDVLKKTSMSATVEDSKGTTVRSNVISESIKELNVDVKLTAQTSSKSENNYMNLSDTIKYKINLTNIGKRDLEYLYIKDILSPYLEISSVLVNGKNIEYDTYYETTDDTSSAKTQILRIHNPLEVGKSIEVEIIAKLEEDMDVTETLKISNKAEIYNDVYLKSTDEIVYYVKPNLSLDDENKQDSDQSTKPDDPNAPQDPDDPTTPDNPNSPDNPNNPSTPTIDTYTISGMAWLDKDGNGAKDQEEDLLNGIKVYAINTSTNNVTEATTDNVGFYELKDLPKGKYLVAFEYDTEKYMLTKYQAEGVSDDDNSNVIKSNLKINGEEKTLAVSDTIKLTNNVSNINMGLMEAKKFDLELEKVISKVTVTNKEGTKTYDEKDTNLAKIEIAGKYLSGSNIIIEYKIKVKNTGEVAGYVKNVVDYMPSSLNFSGASNKGWYESDGNIYNSSLAKTKLEPGETKELKLVLTKTMTESNTGLINNRAEIGSAYNSLGIQDADSTPNNQDKSEDDLGSADLIIGVKTGAAISYVIITLTTILVIFGIAFVINKNILKEG